jgi:molecular chaperone Hsp33
MSRDGVVRALTDDGSFRVIAAVTTDTVRGAAAAQGASGATARRFGELVTGAVLVREVMAPQLRVQAILKGAPGRGSLIADSHPDGSTRGLVNFGASGAEAVAPGAESSGLLQVMRTMPNGALHQGVVSVPPAGSVEDALMTYFQESEQIVSVAGVAALDAGGEIMAAGGFVVQLLPEVGRGPLMIMTERLQSGLSLEAMLRTDEPTAEGLLDELLYGMTFTCVGAAEVAFRCHCSELRLIESLATLPAGDIADMLSSAEPLEIRCDYCKRDYAIAPEALRSAVTPN